MGMYSSFDWESLDIKNLDELVALMKKKSEEKSDSTEYWKQLMMDYLEYKNITFEGFNDWKLQGYWYEGWCQFLIDIAPFLEGEVQFTFESGAPFRLCFHDNIVDVEYVPLEWEKMPFSELKARAGLKENECKTAGESPVPSENTDTQNLKGGDRDNGKGTN